MRGDLHSFQQDRRRRRRNRKLSVSRLDPSLSDRDRQVIHSFDPQLFEALDAADDVEQGIDSADFMQMDLLRRDGVHPAFRVTDESECSDGALFHPIGYGGPLDEVDELSDMTAVRLRWDREFDLLACNSGPAHVSNRNTYVVQAEALRKLFEPRHRHA